MESYIKCPKGHFYKRIMGQCPYCSNEKNNEEDPYNNTNPGVSMVECPNGHFYAASLDKCPYCAGPIKLKVCPNHHAYPVELEECPFCGETNVVDHIQREGNDTIWEEEIKVLSEDSTSKRILVNDHEYTGYYCIGISHSRGYKRSYHIQTEPYNLLSQVEIKPEDNIVFGRTPMTGKEFIKICDVLLDNRMILLLNKVDLKVHFRCGVSFADLFDDVY